MVRQPSLTQADANADAWQVGRTLLERAIRERLDRGGPRGQRAQTPRLLLHVKNGKIVGPGDLSQTPDWAKPIVAAAIQSTQG